MPFSHLLFLLLLLLFTLSTGTIGAFDALPFLQIDFHFYLRLAQCQAKCAEKFPSKVDDPSMDVVPHSSLLELCSQGCLDSDSPTSTRHQPQSQLSIAFAQGQFFFRQSLVHRSNKAADASHGTPMLALRVRPLCAQEMSLGADSPHEKFEAILAVDLRKEEESQAQADGTLQFVVRWRRRPKEEWGEKQEEAEEEPQWITASIEPSRTFHVSSLRAGLFHQFQVQPVSANGPVGAPATSDWLDFGQLAAMGQGLEGSRTSLHFFSQYNLEHGVAAWVRWRREESAENSKAVLNSRLRRSSRHISPSPSVPVPSTTSHSSFPVPILQLPIVFPACQLQLEWANKSSRAVEKFQLDGSDGFLLRHLSFNSEYSVRLLASQTSGSKGQPMPAFLEASFLSLHCAQVFGPGSLECDPEPVHGLSILAFPENGSALVNWDLPDPIGNILLYELALEPLRDSAGQCQVTPSARIVSAQSNSALISLPHSAICQFQVRLMVYDLLGRDATALGHFQFVPAGLSPPLAPSFLQAIGHMDASLMALLFVLFLVPVAALVTLICTFTKQTGRRKPKERRQTPQGTKVEKAKKRKERRARKGEEEVPEKEVEQSLEGMEAAAGKPIGKVNSACNSPQSTTSIAGTEVTVVLARGAGGGTTTDEEEQKAGDIARGGWQQRKETKLYRPFRHGAAQLNGTIDLGQV